MHNKMSVIFSGHHCTTVNYAMRMKELLTADKKLTFVGDDGSRKTKTIN